MSNLEPQPLEEQPGSQNQEQELTKSEGSSWFSLSDENQEEGTLGNSPQTILSYHTKFSAAWDNPYRPEYGRDKEALHKAFKSLKRKANWIEAERKQWYDEEGEEALQYMFRFTPEEIRERAAARHGGKTFYDHVEEEGLVQDLDLITGNESEATLQANYLQRLEEWVTGNHPDAAVDREQVEAHRQESTQGNEQSGGDDHSQGDGSNDGGEYNGGSGNGDRRTAGSESETSIEYEDDSRDADDEDDEDEEDSSGTTSTDRTKLMPNSKSHSSESGSRYEAYSGRGDSLIQTTLDRYRPDHEAARQLQRELSQEQPEETSEETDEEHRKQQEERRDLFFKAKEWRESLDNPQPVQQQQPQQQSDQQQSDQQQSEHEKQERVESRLEVERRRQLEEDLKNIKEKQQRILFRQGQVQSVQTRSRVLTDEQQQALSERQADELYQLRRQEAAIMQRQQIHRLQSRLEDYTWNEILLTERQTNVQQQLENVQQQRQNLEEIRTQRQLNLDEQETLNDQTELQSRLAQEASTIDDQLQEQHQRKQNIAKLIDTERKKLEDWLNSKETRQEAEQRLRESNPWPVHVPTEESNQAWLRKQAQNLQQGEQAQEKESEETSQEQQRPRNRRARRNQQPGQVDRRNQGRQQGATRTRRQQGVYPVEAQNQPASVPPNIAGAQEPQSQGPQQVPQQSNRQEDNSTARNRSQWSDTPSSSGPRGRRRSTNSDDSDPADGGPRFAATREASRALQRVIEESPQQVEGATGQTGGPGLGQASRRLLPAAQIRERGLQVSPFFTNARTRSVIREDGFLEPRRASGGAWVVTADEARNARNKISEERRLSQRQAAHEQATTRPVIHDLSQPPSPSPGQRPARQRPSLPPILPPGPFQFLRRPRPSLPAPLQSLPDLPGRMGGQLTVQPSIPPPLEPPVHPQPPTHLPGLDRFQSQPYQPQPAPPEPLVSSPDQSVEAPVPSSVSTQVESPAPASASPPSRGSSTARPARKSTRNRRSTSRARESKKQAAARRRPARVQKRQPQRRRQRQSPAQAQAEHSGEEQNVDSNPGQAPVRNSPQPQRTESRRQGRRSQPYDISTLRRSTRNRKPPDRYSPSKW